MRPKSLSGSCLASVGPLCRELLLVDGKKEALLLDIRVAGDTGGEAVKGPISSSKLADLWLSCLLCLMFPFTSTGAEAVGCSGGGAAGGVDFLSVKPSADPRLNNCVRFIVWFVGY